VAALLITTLSSTPIISNRTKSLSTMTAFLRKSKAAILELMKTLPDVHIVEEEDFVAWGHKFVEIVVSRKQLGGWMY
jgi:hypothetical protein